jgi:uncharacterized protein YcnI
MRAVCIGVLALGFVAFLAGPASAHVTLHSYDAVQGASDAVVQIRVPNEESAATTTALEIDFPAATPLIGLYVEPTPGWQFQVTNSNLTKPVVTDDGTITSYVSKVVWSGGNIPVGGYQDFNVDVSSMPMAPSIEVKALQTYSNGDIVRWIEETGPNGQEPDHPAPTLTLAAPTSSSSSAAAPSASSSASPAVAASSKSSSSNGLSIAALVVAAVALLAAAFSMWRRHP